MRYFVNEVCDLLVEFILSGASLVAGLSVGDLELTGYGSRASEAGGLPPALSPAQQVGFDVFLPIEHRAELEELLASQEQQNPEVAAVPQVAKASRVQYTVWRERGQAERRSQERASVTRVL